MGMANAAQPWTDYLPSNVLSSHCMLFYELSVVVVELGCLFSCMAVL